METYPRLGLFDKCNVVCICTSIIGRGDVDIVQMLPRAKKGPRGSWWSVSKKVGDVISKGQRNKQAGVDEI